ncbi:hypothetical protein [Bacillus subtilis]|nr:hypothetical protein [Bacillus subtilis]
MGWKVTMIETGEEVMGVEEEDIVGVFEEKVEEEGVEVDR